MFDLRVFAYAIAVAGSCLLSAAPSAAQTVPASAQIRSAYSGLCVASAGGAATSGAAAVQAMCLSGDQDAKAQAWSFTAVSGGYKIVGATSGLCLAIKGASGVQGAAAIQTPCTGAAEQRWSVVATGATVELRPAHSGQCLEIGGGSLEPGATLNQWNCIGADQQKWLLAAPGAQNGLLVGRHAGKCVSARGGSVEPGAKLAQTTCFDTPALTWDIIVASGGARIVNRASGLCAAVPAGAASDGAELIQTRCVQAGASGVWTIRAAYDWVELVSAQNGKCVIVKDEAIEEDAALLQWDCFGSASQHWTISGAAAPSAWSEKITLPITPVAASTLRNGKMLTWSSRSKFEFGAAAGKTYTSIFDPETGKATQKVVSNTGHDMFCPGTSMLADGRILVSGGESASQASIYDPKTNKWSATGELNVARGYNGDTALSTGEALTIGGSWSGGHYGKMGEVWSPKTGEWRKLTGVPSEALSAKDPLGDFLGDQHMWLFGVADGWAFHAGPSAEMHWIDTAKKGRIVDAGLRGDDAYSQNGNIVMYDAGKLLKVGGAPSYQTVLATSSAYVVDFSGGPTQAVKVAKQKPMAFPRSFANSVVLPTGEVVVVGGQAYPITFTDTYAAMLPEIWSPKTGRFTRLAALSTPRTYHSVAVLLTDGRVLAGGGGLCGEDCAANHPDVEILTPPYLLNADGSPAERPEILEAPKTASWGETIGVSAEGKPKTFALVRLNAATHSLNNDQRRMPVKVLSKKGDVYRLKMSDDRGMLLPGDWMLFAMTKKGAPSVAKIIRVQ